ncbi:MAG: hypothetical protein IJP87_01985, partial [Campylobacter sp.]|nr:hypothetical protein [Campylobacter sp.]
MKLGFLRVSLIASAVIFATSASADFTVNSGTTYTNSATGTNGNYSGNWFRPGKEASAGSAGFFESQGSQTAANIVSGNDGKAQYATANIHLGANGDATSLTNMKNSLAIIRETNRLRALDNLPALKVTDYLMAVSQVQTAWSGQVPTSNPNFGHSGIYNVGENLAWAFGITDTNWGRQYSAFGGWYDDEKAKFEAGTMNCDTGAGHYCNIVDGKAGVRNIGYVITGAAIAPDNTGAASGATSYTYGQVFLWNNGDVSYTPDEYLALIEAYEANGGGWNFFNENQTVTVTNAVNDANVKVSGGYAIAGLNATGNTVTIQNGAKLKEVYGGYAVNGKATGNTVTFLGGEISGTLYGGYSENSNAEVISGNKINIGDANSAIAMGSRVGNIANVEELNFYLSKTVNNEDTAIYIIGGAQTDLGSTTVYAYLEDASNLTPSSRIHLINNPATITTPKATNTDKVSLKVAGLATINGAKIGLADQNTNLDLYFGYSTTEDPSTTED